MHLANFSAFFWLSCQLAGHSSSDVRLPGMWSVKQLGLVSWYVVVQTTGVGKQVCWSINQLEQVGRYVGLSNSWGR